MKPILLYFLWKSDRKPRALLTNCQVACATNRAYLKLAGTSAPQSDLSTNKYLNETLFYESIRIALQIPSQHGMPLRRPERAVPDEKRTRAQANRGEGSSDSAAPKSKLNKRTQALLLVTFSPFGLDPAKRYQSRKSLSLLVNRTWNSHSPEVEAISRCGH